MPEKNNLDILNFIMTKPEVIWILALIGAVCVIGVVDFLRCFFEKKKNTIRWVVLILSLLVAFVLSPIVHTLITTIIILWLLILALATIGKKHIIDGIGNIIDKVTNTKTTSEKGEK